jgi:DNA-binding transcriptional regulator/RsmH inhibitor MraZ
MSAGFIGQLVRMELYDRKEWNTIPQKSRMENHKKGKKTPRTSRRFFEGNGFGSAEYSII